jgi:hypothetical protein
MSRIRAVDKLDFLPKKCLVTGRGGDGPFVDFGPDVTYTGADPHNVYIRHDFVEKGAKELGMLSASEAKDLQEERADLIAENAELRRAAQANTLHARAEAAKLAYAGASAASAVILAHNPHIELPNEAIIAAAEELVEPTKEEILKS